MKRHISWPNGDLVKELCFQVTRSLEVSSRLFGCYLVAPNSNLISAIDSASPKAYKKTHCMQKGRFDARIMFSGNFGSFGGHGLGSTQIL